MAAHVDLELADAVGEVAEERSEVVADLGHVGRVLVVPGQPAGDATGAVDQRQGETPTDGGQAGTNEQVVPSQPDGEGRPPANEYHGDDDRYDEQRAKAADASGMQGR